MNKKFFILILMVLSFLKTNAQANEPRHEFSYGINAFRYEMNNHIHNLHVKGKANCFGTAFRYEYNNPGFIYFGFDVNSARIRRPFGFKNSDEDDVYTFHRLRNHALGNVEFRLGYNTNYKGRLSVTPFFGCGGYITPKIKKRGHGFEFESASIYGALGVKTSYSLNSCLDLNFRAKVMYNGTVFTFKEDHECIKNGKPFFGGELALPLVWRIGECRRFAITMEPYATAICFSQKNVIVGSKLLLGYRF